MLDVALHELAGGRGEDLLPGDLERRIDRGKGILLPKPAWWKRIWRARMLLPAPGPPVMTFSVPVGNLHGE